MRNKRGLAIELAILMVLILTALNIVLITVAELNYKIDKDSRSGAQAVIELDKAGDKCLQNLSIGQPMNDGISENYQVSLKDQGENEVETAENAGVYLLTVIDTAGNSLSIRFEVNSEAGDKKLSITEWRRN